MFSNTWRVGGWPMILPRGVTGFREQNDPELPVCNFKAFRGHCYEVNRLLRGNVNNISFVEDLIAKNHVVAILDLPLGIVSVLLNAYFPIIGFAEPHCGITNHLHHFLRIPELAHAFEGFGCYQVMSASELDQPVSEDACQELSPAEIKQIRYWRPMRIGDVVFNFWD